MCTPNVAEVLAVGRTGLAAGGALGPIEWGPGPCIPLAMGTLWPDTGPRASTALGSRPLEIGDIKNQSFLTIVTELAQLKEA